MLSYTRASDVTLSAPPPMPDLAAMTASRIAIEALSPLVPGGDYAVKRVVGETVFVTADIIPDGHDVLAAELLWRAADEAAWHHAPMRLAGNDRWEARFAPDPDRRTRVHSRSLVGPLGHLPPRPHGEARSRAGRDAGAGRRAG